MINADQILYGIMLDAALLVLTVGAVFSLFVGLALLLFPEKSIALSKQSNRWLSLRRPSKSLEIPHNADHLIYRYHKVIGLLILASTSYILFNFIIGYNTEKASTTLVHHFDHPSIAAWLLDAIRWFFIPASLLLLIFGTILATKPSRLKRLESWANHWVSTRKIMQPFEKSHEDIDGFVNRHPRLVGFSLTLLSTYLATSLLILFLNKPV